MSRLLPHLAALVFFPVFITLVLAGLSDDLDRELAPRQHELPLSDFSPRVKNTVISYHQRPHIPHFVVPLVASFTQMPTLNTYLRRLAFTCLLMFTSDPDVPLTAYLNRIPLGKVGVHPVTGLPEGARVYFGVSHTRLQVGEALLLCDRALYPEGDFTLTHPDLAIQKRDRLLGHLRDAGYLAPSEYLSEVNRPLSRAADHRPVF